MCLFNYKNYNLSLLNNGLLIQFGKSYPAGNVYFPITYQAISIVDVTATSNITTWPQAWASAIYLNKFVWDGTGTEWNNPNRNIRINWISIGFNNGIILQWGFPYTSKTTFPIAYTKVPSVTGGGEYSFGGTDNRIDEVTTTTFTSYCSFIGQKGWISIGV